MCGVSCGSRRRVSVVTVSGTDSVTVAADSVSVVTVSGTNSVAVARLAIVVTNRHFEVQGDILYHECTMSVLWAY